MNQFSRNAIFWLILGLLFLTLYSVVQQNDQRSNEIPYSMFLEEVENKNVSSVIIEGSSIRGKHVRDLDEFTTVMPKDDGLVERLTKAGVEIQVKEEADQPWYLLLLVNALPMILLIGIWIF
ncbi:MAG: ATP-dependent metallopeptidase FtsH/Yme1/Tma family protein, partial [Bdellovibrionales bacterium]|nr:ATP-dependent metallopeptidase FtsH/Yme1/Tma family protein [Bdellovibrionales bacterium]